MRENDAAANAPGATPPEGSPEQDAGLEAELDINRRVVLSAFAGGAAGLVAMVPVLFALPALGWGLFGTAVTPRVAVATLALHLVYGAVLGWTLDRDGATASHPGTATAD